MNERRETALSPRSGIRFVMLMLTDELWAGPHAESAKTGTTCSALARQIIADGLAQRNGQKPAEKREK